jgi:hypothetical protein
MPRLTGDQWVEVRAQREAGASFPELAARFGLSHQAIQKRAKKDGWGDGQDVGEVIRRKVAEKVAGVVAAKSAIRKAEIIDAAVDQAAGIVTRHREDWEEHHAVFRVRGIADDFDLGRSAKICSEMLAIRQKAERIAWSLDDAESKPDITIQWAGLMANHA